MKNQNLAYKARTFRLRKGFTQERLAAESGLSLRTIQRIENGESQAYGDSIQKLAQALKIHPDELLDWELQEDLPYLKTLNLSALTFLLFPLLGIIAPLILWIQKKGKIQNVNKIGFRLLLFQLIWSIALIMGLFINWYLMNRNFSLATDIQPSLITDYQQSASIFILTMYSINLLLILFNQYRISKSRKVFYF